MEQKANLEILEKAGDLNSSALPLEFALLLPDSVSCCFFEEL